MLGGMSLPTDKEIENKMKELKDAENYRVGDKDINPVSYTHLTLPTNREE